MSDIKMRTFRLFGDEICVTFTYSQEYGIYLGEYPDFSETPRYTSCGRPWVNVLKEDCPYANEDYADCGSCRYFCVEKSGDLIGVCENSKMRINQSE